MVEAQRVLLVRWRRAVLRARELSLVQRGRQAPWARPGWLAHPGRQAPLRTVALCSAASPWRCRAAADL